MSLIECLKSFFFLSTPSSHRRTKKSVISTSDGNGSYWSFGWLLCNDQSSREKKKGRGNGKKRKEKKKKRQKKNGTAYHKPLLGREKVTYPIRGGDSSPARKEKDSAPDRTHGVGSHPHDRLLIVLIRFLDYHGSKGGRV